MNNIAERFALGTACVVALTISAGAAMRISSAPSQPIALSGAALDTTLTQAKEAAHAPYKKPSDD
ncbi:MAG TPA: hypothetical protein VIB98_08360, partial [Gemmatimonadaceae bacterium]